MGNVLSCVGKKTKVIRGEDPFHIRIIVEELSRYMSFQDLKQCRLVNCLWEEIATPLLTVKCRPIKLSDISKVQQLNGLLSPCFPCTTFILDCPVSSSLQKEDIQVEEQEFPLITFLEITSPLITELHLGESACQGWENLPQGRFSKINFPCLKTLGITLNDGSCPVDVRPQTRESFVQLHHEFSDSDPELAKHYSAVLYPINFYVKLILQSASSLKQVHLTTGDCWKCLAMFLGILKRHQSRLRVTQFQWLGLRQSRCLLTLHLTLTLQERMLELHSLELQLGVEDDAPWFAGSLFLLLQSQHRTLKTFKMEGIRICLPEQFLPLSMPKLHTLAGVVDPFNECFWHTFTAERFPALRSLALYTSTVKWCHSKEHGSRIFPLDTLEELKLVPFRWGERISRAIFSELSQRFPRLKKLSVTAKPHNVREMCKLDWLCLEQLTLVCEDSYFNVDKVIKMVNSKRLFKRLKVLEIWCEEVKPWSDLRLSDASGFRLLKLKNLTCLDLRGCRGKQLVKLSGIMIRIMKKKFTVLL